MTRTRATAIGFTAVLLWALLALFTVGSAPVPPLQLNAMCFALGGTLGLIWAIVTGQLSALRRIPLPAFALGTLGLFGYHALYFAALRNAPPAQAGLIAYLWPLLIVLFSGLLPGERLRPGHYMGGLAGFAGAALIIMGGSGGFGSEHLTGYALALACALTWSGYSVLSRRFGTVPTVAVAAFCLVTAVLSLVLHLLIEDTVTPNGALGWAAILGLGLPLYIVTMSSQNMPGVVVLKSAGYEPPVSATVTVTGLTSLLLAPFGGFAFNFAAITAALCAGPETDPDPAQRYKAVLVSGSVNILAGLFGATIISLFLIAPEALVLAIAGIALLGTITASLTTAVTDPRDRDAALVTFMMVVSGVSFFSIGAPVWGLLLGLVVKFVLDRRNRN